MKSQAIDSAIAAYKEKNWKVYFRPIHDEMPVEDITLAVYIAESEHASNLAERGSLPDEFLFLDLEIMAAELQHPELVPFSHCQGHSKTCRLSQDWNGHLKGKLAIATYAPDKISGLDTKPAKVCHLWLIEA
ncbi:MAG: hypothetical protein NTX82_04575 [Candidatus Parcubacteria bacterium]|nr:hypothetical protein [Candidatus Parcubacteria bacterium]